MPTYEYKCDACGYAFERFHSMTAEPIKRCPECGKAKVKRLIGTGAGLIFKGSGFYITDYRDKSYTDKAKAESGSTTATETKSDAKPAEGAGAAAAAATPSTDAKPAAKSEPAPPPPKPEMASKSAAKPKGGGQKKK